jgi:class 3 adenylate cyclase
MFARSGDVNIAYQVVGYGPIDLVYVEGAYTHRDVLWDATPYRHFCERLAEFTRLILFDKRGLGMSDRVPGATPLEVRMDDIRAVMDAVGSEEAAVLGESEGGPLSMLFAAAHPERTRALILQGAEVRERKDDEWPWGEATQEEFDERVVSIPERWGQGRGVTFLFPSLENDPSLPQMQSWLAKLQRNAGTPAAWEAFARMAFDIDVRDVVHAIHVPTLILHAVGDRVCDVGNARWLAANLPDAHYIERPGGDHVAYLNPDDVIPDIREFLTGTREAEQPERVLASLLFTDIVGSTQRAETFGDSRWRDLLAQHHAAVRAQLARFRGREVDTAGDGFFAVFDGPARAIRAALAAIDAVRPLGIELRAGVHTGEVEEMSSGAIAGIAVHVGARIASAASPGEVLVSSAVRDLVAGSGLRFVDRGEHVLKGVDEPRRLYAVAN